MPVTLTCPTCQSRLRAPDGSAGRTFRCPRCRAAIVVPAAANFAFDDPAGPADEPTEADAGSPRKGRRPTASKKPAAGYNPFAGEPGEEPADAPPKKRRYRKDGDYNPFGDVPADEVPDPVGEGFEFGLEAPPPQPTGEFDFGPLDPRDEGGPHRRRP